MSLQIGIHGECLATTLVWTQEPLPTMGEHVTVEMVPSLVCLLTANEGTSEWPLFMTMLLLLLLLLLILLILLLLLLLLLLGLPHQHRQITGNHQLC
jgi:hypothetical protein